MKWRNHKLVTFSVVYSVTGSLVSAISAMTGSVVPDVIEIGGIIPHRTITHCLWMWMGMSCFFWVWLQSTGFSSIALYSAFFFTAGCALHVIEDALSYGGVPVFNPSGKKIGLGIYRTGTVGEELMVWGLVVVIGGFSGYQGYWNAEYLSDQIKIVGNLFSGLFAP